MLEPRIPSDETQRLDALRQLDILDTPAEERFDRITRVAQRYFAVPIALVSLVDAGRQWFKSRQGLDACETPRGISFCGHAILDEGILYVPNALEDVRFADNPLVTGGPKIRFYAGAPLHAPGGQRIGTLCIIDDKPHQLSAEDMGVLRDLADGVEAELERSHLLRAQAELGNRERQLQQLIQLSPGVTYVCAATGDFSLRYVSAQVERMLGLRAQDFTAASSFWLDLVHPDDRVLMLESLKASTSHSDHAHEYRLRHADGSYRWIHDKRHLVRDELGNAVEMVGLWMDITERKINEERTRESVRLLDQIIDNLPVMMFLKRASDLRMVMFNKAGEEMLGYPREALLGKNDHDNFTREEADFFTLKDRQVLDGAGFEDIPEENITARDGSSRILHTIKIALRDEQGKPQYLLGISEDISKRKRDERRILDQNRLLDAISHAQAQFITQAGAKGVFNDLLTSILSVTDSEYGFLGEVLHSPDGKPYLKTYAITNIAWDENSRNLYEKTMPQGMEFRNLDTLFGHVLRTGKPVIANDPDHDPRRGGLPDGHPPLHAFLGIPIHVSGQLVAMAGLANRPGGYDQGAIDILQPLLITIGQLVEAWRNELERRHSADLLRNVLDAAYEVSIIATDTGGLITAFNRGAERLLGYSASEMVGKQTPAILHLPEEVMARGQALTVELGHHVEGFRVFVEKPELDGSEKREWTYVRKDGSHVPVSLVVTTMRANSGEIIGYLGIAEDITERKRIEQMKSEFVSTVSHELRTPLTSISGALGLLAGGAMGVFPAQTRPLVDIAFKNSQRLNNLINDLLDMEKFAAGKMSFDMQIFPLMPQIEQALEANKAYAEQRHVRFELMNRVDGIEVRIDSQRFQQVLANFLSNAAKFSPEEGSVGISIRSQDGWVRVSIRDHGHGVPDEFRNRIFEKFSQADSSDTRQKGGTGLGLAITKELAARMGGRVGFDSVAGEGATFWVELPVYERTAISGLESVA